MSELNSWPPIQQLFQTFHLKLMEAPEEKSGEHQSHQDWGTMSVQNFMAVHLEIFHPGRSHPQNHAAWFPINVIWTALCFPTKHIQLYMNIIFRKLWCWTNGWRHAAFLDTQTQQVQLSSIHWVYSTYRSAAPPSPPLALFAASEYGSHRVLLLSVLSQGCVSVAGNREEAQVLCAVQPLHRSTAIRRFLTSRSAREETKWSTQLKT